ncbi:MAG: DMT family transporter [Nitratireductor sp.]
MTQASAAQVNNAASAPLQNAPQKGIALGFIGGLVISFDVPFIRLAGSDPWLMMALRGGILAIIFLAYWYFARPKNMPAKPFRNPAWVMVAIIYGLNNIFFTLAVYNTSTANLVFILAFNSMAAAIFSWWLIGEKPKVHTWIAIALTIFGVGLIVQNGLSSGSFLGDAFALICAISLGYGVTLTRKSGVDMSLAPGFGGLVSVLFALPLIVAYSSAPQSWFFAISNAALIVPIAAFCLALAPSFIPAPQAAMFYLLETVLAPVWIWIVFGEIVETTTLIGGAIILMALFGHSYLSVKQTQKA